MNVTVNQYIRKLIYPAVTIAFISHQFACQTTSKYIRGSFDEDVSEINIYGLLDKEFSSEYFGSFRFVFENRADRWLTIKKVSLSFKDSAAQNYIQVLDEDGLSKWGQAIRSQSEMNVSANWDI